MPDEKLPIKRFNTGDIICSEGELGLEMYILKKGKVDVVIKGIKVATIDAKGSILGEIYALMGTKRIATLVAMEPTEFYAIENVNQYILNNPESGLMIAKTLASKLMDMNTSFVKLKKNILRLIKNEDLSLLQNNLKKLNSIVEDIEHDMLGT